MSSRLLFLLLDKTACKDHKECSHEQGHFTLVSWFQFHASRFVRCYNGVYGLFCWLRVSISDRGCTTGRWVDEARCIIRITTVCFTVLNAAQERIARVGLRSRVRGTNSRNDSLWRSWWCFICDTDKTSVLRHCWRTKARLHAGYRWWRVKIQR